MPLWAIAVKRRLDGDLGSQNMNVGSAQRK